MVKNSFQSKSGKSKKSNPVDAALNFLSYRERSEKEVRDRLSKRFSLEEIEVVVGKLKELKLINDDQFTQSYIESRSRSRPRSRRLLKLELKQKGIKIDEDVLNLDKTEEQLALLAIEKKHNLKTFEQRVRFLQSRGFSWEVIEKVLKNRYNEGDVS